MKKPLYRKVNTRARNVHHQFGSDAKYDRNTKLGLKKSMKKDKQRGLDYTPLYRFLLSKVGKNWDEIYSEAISRLDKKEPIFHIISTTGKDTKGYVRCDESTYYSKLYIDENNILQIVDPSITNETLTPNCRCCTHTFNGKVFVRKFNPLK